MDRIMAPAGGEPVPDGIAAAGQADDPAFPAQHLWFIALLGAIVLSRAALLILSRRYLMSDEATVGMMALDILDGKPIPLFLYGQHYGGGHVAEALLMVPWLKLFGPLDLIVKAVPAAIGCLVPVVVYGLLYRFFSKRLALVSMAIFAFCCPFITYNFLVNGSMTTMLFSWIGLYFFFYYCYDGKGRLAHLFLAGAALGFAHYCFDYAILYIVACAGFLLYRFRWRFWRGWKALAALAGGILAGDAPLIWYNCTHQFASLGLYKSGSNQLPFAKVFFLRAIRLAIYDLPAFFTTQIIDFAPRIPWISYVPWIVFCVALAYLAAVMRGPIRKVLGGFFRLDPPPVLEREDRILVFAYFFLLYALLYCISYKGGTHPRYCLLFYPPLPILFAGALLRLARSRLGWAIAALILFMAPQFWFTGLLAGDKTVTEWRITMHGEDLGRLVKYLEDNNLTTVIAPYEIKWKLMFASNRRIVCSARPFGFDREEDYNQEVRDRIAQKRAPLTLILDKDMRMPEIAKKFSPEKSFDMQWFVDYTRKNEIKYAVTQIGDYIVFHHFTKEFEIPNL